MEKIDGYRPKQQEVKVEGKLGEAVWLGIISLIGTPFLFMAAHAVLHEAGALIK